MSKYNHKDSVIRKKVQDSASIISFDIKKNGLKNVILKEMKGMIPSKSTAVVAVSNGILDTTALALSQMKDQIRELNIININLKKDNIKAKFNLDSLRRENFVYADKYVSLKLNPLDSSNKESNLYFKYRAELNYDQYSKKKFPIIGAKRSYIDIWSDDSRTTINGFERLRIEQKEPQFGLRVQLRSIYSISSKKFYAGPGLSFDLKRYNLLGYSYYNLNDGKWIYAVGINYDLIRF